MDQRLQFLEDVRLGRLSISELCAHRQISRKTGYNWHTPEELYAA